MFARPLQLGEERVFNGEHHLSGAKGDQVATYVVARRIAPALSETDSSKRDDRFLILAARGIAPDTATTLYRRRWEIGTLFGALKPPGFKLEKTYLTMPDRVERLMGLLALAFAWTHIVGDKRAFSQGQPPTKTNGRPEHSLFRYGLGWLQSILTTPEPQPRAFFTCLRDFEVRPHLARGSRPQRRTVVVYLEPESNERMPHPGIHPNIGANLPISVLWLLKTLHCISAAANSSAKR